MHPVGFVSFLELPWLALQHEVVSVHSMRLCQFTALFVCLPWGVVMKLRRVVHFLECRCSLSLCIGLVLTLAQLKKESQSVRLLLQNWKKWNELHHVSTMMDIIKEFQALWLWFYCEDTIHTWTDVELMSCLHLFLYSFMYIYVCFLYY